MKNIDYISASLALRAVAMGMSGIFVPIYLYYELGFGLNGTLAFYLLEAVSFFGMALLAIHAIRGFGLSKTMAASAPMLILAYALLAAFRGSSIIYAAAPLLAANTAFYFMPFHTVYARNSGEKRGGSIGKTWFVVRLAAIAGPAAGGLILSGAPFSTLFGAVIVVLALSHAVLLKVAQGPNQLRMEKIALPRWKMEAVEYLSQGFVIDAFASMWPIIAFSVISQYASLGSVFSIAGIGVAVLSLYLGRATDKHSRAKIMAAGYALAASAYFLTWSAGEVAVVLAVIVLSQSAFALMEPALLRNLFAEGMRKGNLISSIFARELLLRIATISILATAFLLQSLRQAFLVFGIVMIAFLAWKLLEKKQAKGAAYPAL